MFRASAQTNNGSFGFRGIFNGVMFHVSCVMYFFSGRGLFRQDSH